MLTRTEPLALKTFLAKLSRSSHFWKTLKHDDYNEYFDKEVPQYRRDLKIKEKKEWVAAVSWTTFNGKDKARMESLQIE